MARGPLSYDPSTGLPWGTPSVAPTTNATSQAEQLRAPEPITNTTAPNPLQTEAYNNTGDAYKSANEAYGRASQYENEVTAGTAAETRRELERARDEISVGMEAEGAGAMSRGADPSLFRNRSLAAGKRGLNELQGRLAGESLRAREGAVNTRIAAAGGKVNAANARTSAASSSASEQRMLGLGTMAQRLAENRALVEQAETQARLNEMPYQRLATMMDSVARNANVYQAAGGGGGGVTPRYGGATYLSSPGSPRRPYAGSIA